MSTMKGLVQFIADLRNARSRDIEERRINTELVNIRNKFKDPNLNGYQKKKYICKLMYIYILGWDIDFGQVQAIDLITSEKYTEKQIGYLATSTLLNEKDSLMNLVVNSLRKDLESHLEVRNCLALNCIANTAGSEMAEALVEDVHKLLISPLGQEFVKKKASLTMLRIYKKAPHLIQPQWSHRIIALINDSDFGVVTSAVSLIIALSVDRPDEYENAYLKAAQLLRFIFIENKSPDGYKYYNVPSPWLSVKLLQLMQCFSRSNEDATNELVDNVVNSILDCCARPPKSVQQNNAQNAIYFEVVNLIIHMGVKDTIMDECITRLGEFITSKEINIRYLALERMAYLASSLDDLSVVKKHFTTVLQSLKDRDISIRRQALDLLYYLCDAGNVAPIVNELLRYLQASDYSIREEMVIKVAVLIEKYATDPQWYIDMTFKLLSTAGDQVPTEVWIRVVQVVTNNGGIQSYAVEEVLRYLKKPLCHECVIKVAAYLLGEFGYLISDKENCKPIDQFTALIDKYHLASPASKVMILSAYVKFGNLFPEIKSSIMTELKRHSQALNTEVQQRSCEYIELLEFPESSLLNTVCDEMPLFPERQSALFKRIQSKGIASNRRKNINRSTTDDIVNNSPAIFNNEVTGSSKQSTTSDSSNNDFKVPRVNSISTNLQGLKINSSESLNSNSKSPMNKGGVMKPSPLTSTKTGAIYYNSGSQQNQQQQSVFLTTGWEYWYKKLLISDSGKLYEDNMLSINIRSQFRSNFGGLILTFENRSNLNSINSFTTTIINEEPENVNATIKTIPDSTISKNGTTEQKIQIEAINVFSKSPIIKISYMAGAMQTFAFKLPVVISKFLTPGTFDNKNFFPRWKQIGSGPYEYQEVKDYSPYYSSLYKDLMNYTLTDLNWGICENVDTNPRNVIAAAVLHTTNSNSGCLLRLEPNDEARKFRITIRSTNIQFPKEFGELVTKILCEYDPEA